MMKMISSVINCDTVDDDAEIVSSDSGRDEKTQISTVPIRCSPFDIH